MTEVENMLIKVLHIDIVEKLNAILNKINTINCDKLKKHKYKELVNILSDIEKIEIKVLGLEGELLIDDITRINYKRF